MTYLSLKIVALISMTIDHLGAALGTLGLDPTTYTLMRSLGRIAFPIYAFGIVNGSIHTSNKDRYFYKLALFMPLSQIPFSMVSSYENSVASFTLSSLGSLRIFPRENLSFFMPLVLVLVFAYIHRRNWKMVLVIALSSLMASFYLVTSEGYVLSSPSYLNVFYTLAVGAYFIRFLDLVKEKDLRPIDLTLEVLVLVPMILVFISTSDYGLHGLILILGIYLLKDKKPLYLAYMALWLVFVYGPGLSSYLVISLVSVVLVALYNGDKGKAPKALERFFYAYYPLHLWVGAILSLVLI